MQIFLRKIILATGMITGWYATAMIHCSDSQVQSLYNECYQPVRVVLRLANEDLRRLRLGELISRYSYVDQVPSMELATESTRAAIISYDRVAHDIIAQLIAGNNTLKLHRAFVAAMFALFEEAIVKPFEKSANEQQCECACLFFCNGSFDAEEADTVFGFLAELLTLIVDDARMVSIMAVSVQESAGIRCFIRQQHQRIAQRLLKVLDADPVLFEAANFSVQKPEEEEICTSVTLLAYPKKALARVMEMLDAMAGYGLKMMDADSHQA